MSAMTIVTAGGHDGRSDRCMVGKEPCDSKLLFRWDIHSKMRRVLPLSQWWGGCRLSLFRAFLLAVSKALAYEI